MDSASWSGRPRPLVGLTRPAGDRIRVALVSEHASPLTEPGEVDAGGQNVHVAALARSLAEAGHTVTVHTRRTSPDQAQTVALAPGVTVEHVDAGPAAPLPKDELLPHMGELARNLHRSWVRRRPDVAHAHFWMSGVATLGAARPLDIPVVQTFHALGVVKRREQGTDDTSPSERLGIEAGLAAAVDCIIATCKDEASELVRIGAPPERITVAPCGVDLGAFRPDGPVEHRPAGVARLLSLGRLVPRKGTDVVIRALASVPRAELIVAGGPPAGQLGEDPEARRLLDVARRAGVAGRVRFVGGLPRHRVPALLRSADLVVCTPWYEPFGMVPLEAMACGVPVVARPVGGLAETVRHGVTGLHVADPSPRALAEAITGLLADPDRRRTMARAARACAESRYSWERVATLTVAAYRSVLDEPADAVLSAPMGSAW